MESQEFTMFGRFLGENIISKKITWKVIESNRFYVTHKEEAVQYLIYKGYKLEDDIFKDKEETGGGDTPTDNPGDNPGTGDTPVDPDPTPDNPSTKDEYGYVEFASQNNQPFSLTTEKGSSTITPAIKSWNGKIEYSTDNKNWNEFIFDQPVTSSTDGKLYLRGEGNTKISAGDSPTQPTVNPGINKRCFKFTVADNDLIDCKGNIENLLDYKKVANNEHPKMDNECFAQLFYKNKYLASAPELPATILSKSCYANMFDGCTSLKKAPELPAIILAESCYSYMFNMCTSLEEAPKLQANELANYCYSNMFNNCQKLTIPPELPAITIPKQAYLAMFDKAGLKKVPEKMPGINLGEYCYSAMFRNCSNLEGTIHCPISTKDNNRNLLNYNAINGTKNVQILFDLEEYEAKEENINDLSKTSLMLKSKDGKPFSIKFWSQDSHASEYFPWDGAMYISNDGADWQQLQIKHLRNDQYGTDSFKSSDDGVLYLRGENNTHIQNLISSNGYRAAYRLIADEEASNNWQGYDCIGNIETLFDYKKVANGEHPVISNGKNNAFPAFDRLFSNTKIVTPPTFPITSGYPKCFEKMFTQCNKLETIHMSKEIQKYDEEIQKTIRGGIKTNIVYDL